MADINNGSMDSPPDLFEDVLYIAVIGEQRVEKTSFIRAFYDRNKWAEIISDNGVSVYPCKFQVTEQIMRRIIILEIPGDPAFCEEQRARHYYSADAIVFIYAIADLQGLDMLVDKWIPETNDIIDLNEMPVVVVGIKSDDRGEPLKIEPLVLANIQRSSAYMECSVNYLQEVDDIFDYIFEALTVPFHEL